MKMLKRFIRYYKPHRRLFAWDMICSFLLSACDLFYPMITRSMMNDFIPNRKMRLLVLWGATLLGIYFVKLGLKYFVQYYGHIVGVRMQADMRREAFKHVEKLPFSFFDDNKTGSIMSRIVNDLQEVSELAHHGPENIMTSFFLLVGSFILMARSNIWLTLILFAALPFLVWFSATKRLKLSRASTETRAEISEINATLENSISGVRVAKAFENASYETQKFDTCNKRFVRARGHYYKAMAEFFAGNAFILDVLNVLILIAGGLFTYYEKITFADFTMFIIFVNLFLTPIKNLINFIEMLQDGMTGFRRFCELVDVPPEQDDAGAAELADAEGRITFSHVDFSYGEGRRQILSDVNLDIAPGKTVALVGPSGAGKTTLCHIIPRFYEISSGTVSIDGKDIRTLTRASVRRAIGIVTQEVFLFTGTIYENIAYGREDATRESVIEAAKLANIHEFVMSLPEGYDTFVGERGVKLSGGQKQRISIARVFLKNPPILILDEATSALDNATEILIQQSLNLLCRGRTTLVVAHRLSTVKNADEILVLTRNGVQERGTHAALLAQNGLYAELYRAQFRDEDAGGESDGNQTV